MTNHPLGDEIYAAYASGALSAPMRLLVDAQAAVEPRVARARDAAEAMAGALLETAGPAPLNPHALDDILSAIDALEAGAGEAGRIDPAQADGASRRAAKAAGTSLDELLTLPEPVRSAALESAQWKFAGPGVRVMELMREGPAKAELIRLEPGRGVPRHSHDGREFTLVLHGAFHDGVDRYATGELCVGDPALEHKPVADPEDVCIALAVTDGPLAFTGPLGWVQRALGA